MDNPIVGNDKFVLVKNPYNEKLGIPDYTRDETLNNIEPIQAINEFVSEEEEESMNEINDWNQFHSEFNEKTIQKIVFLSKDEKQNIKDNSEDITEKYSQEPLLKDSNQNNNQSEKNEENNQNKFSCELDDATRQKKSDLSTYEKPKKKDIYLFTKGENVVTEKCSQKPVFKDSNLVLKKNKKRKKDMDNMFKKVRGKVSKRIEKKFKYKLKRFSFLKFNQNGNKMKNKGYLNMRLKELLKNIYIEFINPKTKNNVYILKEDDKKFLASLENDFYEEKLRPILNMKMEDIYIEFFNSKEYQDLIQELIDKGNNYYYIFTFIEKNKNFVEYYKGAKSRKKKK